jgi:hypothetical protein
MYSELFETIIRTSGENTDDVNSPEPDNFWAENRLFEQILKEMSSPTSEQLAETFTGVLQSVGISDGISEEKLTQASSITIAKYGAGKKEGLNFNFSEVEQNSRNPKEAYLQNFATFVANKIGHAAQQFNDFIRKLK